ncbi:2-polyprenyl-6-methoxyphenol hydroxylase [Duganella sacchari]|uniref:2-polyprenyl-6-methoxyphenol hydroxylase n=1 Tax=Duganella sacchari TaxID=551987 RepID=A0A1M7KV02_9BURK|nr:FAD-dependent monooxygenase [Duganella sacchari]SHM69043.1 2-polyprenyl-6-methoxyphenol hydroxylase [Duganella sacchari]
MSNTAFHVAIIGAGLGGLCLAQGLKKHGIACDVFERDAALDSRPQGYRLRINADGQRALQHCLSPRQFALFKASCADDLPRTQALDAQLGVDTRWIDAWRDDADAGKEQELKADRQMLREVLMCGIEDRVHFNKALHELNQHGDEVMAGFADGSHCRSSLLVGADGSNSRVAALRFPQVRGLDTGAVCIYGKMPLEKGMPTQIAPLLREGTSVIFDANLAVVVDAMQFAPSPLLDTFGLRAVPDYLYWAIIGLRARFGLAGDTPLPANDTQLLHRISAVTRGWSPGLKALFDETPAGLRAMLPVRQAPSPGAWPASRITLLGDAAHVMSPASGLGCNTALQDAELLVRQLASATAGTLDQAIRFYEQGMCEQAGAALRSSACSGVQLYGAPAEC